MAQPKEVCYEVSEHIKFAVKTAGQGDPVVFLHGAGGLNWDPFLEQLSESYTVYAPHLPGTANSTGLEHIQNLWDLILVFYDLFDRLGLDSATVIGHSLGGMIASELAATDQSRVSRLIAIAPAGLFLESHPIPDLFAMLPEEMAEKVVADPNSSVAQMMKQVPEDVDERLEVMIHQIQNMQAAAKFLWPIPDKGLKKRMHRIKAPTLLIWGKQDGLIPVVYADEFKKKIPNAQVALIDNASHLVTLEQTEKVISTIRQFISSHTGAADKTA
jgi:pimeloyl-ACP methyl ester carboxylesterase